MLLEAVGSEKGHSTELCRRADQAAPTRKHLPCETGNLVIQMGFLAIPEPINHNKCSWKWRKPNQTRRELHSKCGIALSASFVPKMKTGEDSAKRAGTGDEGPIKLNPDWERGD